jgi:integrase
MTRLCPELIAEHFARLAADKINQHRSGHPFGVFGFPVNASPVIAQNATEQYRRLRASALCRMGRHRKHLLNESIHSLIKRVLQLHQSIMLLAFRHLGNQVPTLFGAYPAELTKQLREKLPKRPKRKLRHHPALPYAETPQFMTELAGAGGTAAQALRFLIFTVGRTSEVLGTRWTEIDRPRAIWKIPGARMKMDEDHNVPLTDPALAILDKMRDGSQSELIFPSVGDGPFSIMAMLAVPNRLGYGHVTVHGFRATFATRAEECTDYPDGVREATLAHKYKNETVAAYQRGAKLEKRRALMNDWTKHVCGEPIVAAIRDVA